MTRQAGSKPRVLVIAGHDRSGAGVDADRAALRGLDVELVTVITAHTDQDERGVRSIGARDPSAWREEALAELERGVDALKFGLLPGCEHVEAAARIATEFSRRHPRGFVVVDPVLAASSGSRFLDARAVEALRGELCGAGVILTPNLPEAAEIARVPLGPMTRNAAARDEAMCLLLGLGLRAVVLKGGHGDEDPVCDLWADLDGRSGRVEHARIANGQLRGSGCRYATRLAALLALENDLPWAVRDASAWVRSQIAGTRELPR